MYLDNSLNKLLPSCRLLPLLLRVISVLIVFLSIWSHCFSAFFLCYFLSSKIDYEYPSKPGAGTEVCRRGASCRGPAVSSFSFSMTAMEHVLGRVTGHGICKQTWSFQHCKHLNAKSIQDPTSARDSMQPALGHGLSLRIKALIPLMVRIQPMSDPTDHFSSASCSSSKWQAQPLDWVSSFIRTGVGTGVVGDTLEGQRIL